ncbi:MAG: hypothetical protein M1445_06305 [Bacteroidetes bacterium]|nr:hypothetical protein [Bacteroidota bacterium]
MSELTTDQKITNLFVAKMSSQLSRIESSPKVEMFRFMGQLALGFLPRTKLAMDYCFYFMPDQHEPLTLCLTNVIKLEKSVNKFMKRIGYTGDISLDKLPNNFGCKICNSQKGAGQNLHHNHCEHKMDNQNNCDEQ